MLEKAAPEVQPETKRKDYAFDNFAEVDEKRTILRREIQQVLETSLPENQ